MLKNYFNHLFTRYFYQFSPLILKKLKKQIINQQACPLKTTSQVRIRNRKRKVEIIQTIVDTNN